MKAKMHISGSSLLEAVIAIAIISICLSIGLSVFVKVTNVQPPVDFYTMDSELKLAIAHNTDSTGLQSNWEFDSNRANTLRIESQTLSDQLLQIVHEADTLDFKLVTFNTLER
ncbi:MAG: hypothetical protein ABJM06_10070 [Gilvibacter sp.]